MHALDLKLLDFEHLGYMHLKIPQQNVTIFFSKEKKKLEQVTLHVCKTLTFI